MTSEINKTNHVVLHVDQPSGWEKIKGGFYTGLGLAAAGGVVTAAKATWVYETTVAGAETGMAIGGPVGSVVGGAVGFTAGTLV